MGNLSRDLYDEPELKEETGWLYDDEDDETFHTMDLNLDDSFFDDPLPSAETVKEEPAAAKVVEEEPAAPAAPAEDYTEEEPAVAEETPAEEYAAEEYLAEEPAAEEYAAEEDFDPDFDAALEGAFEPGFGTFGEEPFEPGFEPDFEVSDESYDFYTAGEETPDDARPARQARQTRSARPERSGSAGKRSRHAAPVPVSPEYEPEAFPEAETASEGRKKGNFLPFVIILLLLLLAAGAVTSVLYVRRSNSQKEEAALEALARSAVDDVSKGLYDEALQKADKMYYTSGYSDKIRQKWDDERATLIDYIEGERKRADSQPAETAAEPAAETEPASETAEPSLLSLDECIEMAKNELPFSNFDVIIQDQILYIAFWQAGYGDQAATAKQNRGEALESWNAMQDDIRSANNHMRIVLNENGHENYDLIYALLNDIDTEYTLFEVMNGLVTYAAVR